MTNYNERLDEILDFIENYGVSASTEGFDKTDSRAEAKQALLDWHSSNPHLTGSTKLWAQLPKGRELAHTPISTDS